MPCRILHFSSPDHWPEISAWLQGRDAPQGDDTLRGRVLDILQDVQQRGDAALVDYTRRFDCPDFSAGMLLTPKDALREAAAVIPDTDLRIIEEAIENIRRYHLAQVQHSWCETAPDGTILGRLVRPVDRAGLYVPGGQGGETPLISSLLMNAIPAQVAGVGEIVLASPPRRDGSLNPYILAAAHLLGLEHVLRVGSAWAIAAMAYGTESCPAVDVIAGPGNIYVTMAKQLCIGRVGIDMVAGPSEIVILAEPSATASLGTVAPPEWLAADMLSQAEHDPLASALCIVVGAQEAQAYADRLLHALEEQLENLPRNAIARRSLADWGGIVFVPDLDTGLELVNRLAPEHLELALHAPWASLGRIRNAGAIFLGWHSPEPVGDYFAGPNHVLPTMGTARFSSGLSVETFCKKSSLIAVNQAYTARHGEKIARLARLEGLEAHARSVEQRLKP